MSVTYVPEGYIAGDMLTLPVFLSDPVARVSPPPGWLVAILPDGTPLELEHSMGFFTAFWKIAEEDEPEVILDPGDDNVHVVAQILAYHNDSGEEWKTPPVGVFAVGSSTDEGGGVHLWKALTDTELNLYSGNSVLMVLAANEEQNFSSDTLSSFQAHFAYGESTYGNFNYGGIEVAGTTISAPEEIEAAYSGSVLFRTATAEVEAGTSTALLDHVADSETPDIGLLLLLQLSDVVTEEQIPFHETSTLTFASKHDLDIIGFSDGEHMEFSDIDIFDFEETAIPFIAEFSVVFNESLTSPGFRIRLRGLLDYDNIEVYRRDPIGRYRDQRVRGLADVDVISDTMDITDYEAPLNTILHYYIRLTKDDGSTFHFGPVHPKPDRYIPTLNSAYGSGTAFLKPIDAPELGRPVMVDEEGFQQWETSGNVLAAHRVLGRRNRIIITDVMGGREGSFTGHAVLHHGQSVDEIISLFSGGHTLLIQNHNPTYSGFPDMYVKVTDVSYERRTKMVHYGELSNPAEPQVIFTFTADYEEQDRPDPLGEVIADNTWQDILDYYGTWERVFEHNDTWFDVLKRSVRGLTPPWEESS